jgi:D-glycero-beta-D-manno-heptose 1-phosphate adenylyltransferase
MTRLRHIQQKLASKSEANQRIASWRIKNEKIIFTNGCFDILHEGHVTYLAQAANLGHKLVVAINTDASVKRLEKGEDRPINSEESRALVLASLAFVDLVVLFEPDSPLELIQLLKPDVLVKGADYDAAETNPASKKFIVGSDFVKSYGGVVRAIPLVEGFSTSALIEKIKK